MCLYAWRKPADPVANRSYIARDLDIPLSAMTDLVTLTGLGDAGAHSPPQLNLNTDRAGLSFGLVQWAGPVGDLEQIVTAFEDADALESSPTARRPTSVQPCGALPERLTRSVVPAGTVTLATSDAHGAYRQATAHASMIPSQR